MSAVHGRNSGFVSRMVGSGNISEVVQLLSDKDGAVRMSTGNVIGMFNDPDFRQLFKPLQDDESEKVRNMAKYYWSRR